MASAAVSPERHDTVALAWTKAAILDCLGQARQALERFAGEPGDLSILAFVVDNLHQVHGCLRMLELRGATRLAEELELFAKALADGQVSPRGDCLGRCSAAWSNCPHTLSACAVRATTCPW